MEAGLVQQSANPRVKLFDYQFFLVTPQGILGQSTVPHTVREWENKNEQWEILTMTVGQYRIVKPTWSNCPHQFPHVIKKMKQISYSPFMTSSLSDCVDWHWSSFSATRVHSSSGNDLADIVTVAQLLCCVYVKLNTEMWDMLNYNKHTAGYSLNLQEFFPHTMCHHSSPHSRPEQL